MAILLLPWPLAPEPFVRALKAQAPDLPVWLDGDRFAPEDVEAVCAFRPRKGVLGRHPKLKLVFGMAAGVDPLLSLGEVPPHVALARMVDPGQAFEIAQYVVGAALDFTRDFGLYRSQQARHLWQRQPARETERCRVGVLGLGAVGTTIAGAFASLGYPVAAWVRSPRTVPGISVYAGAHGERGLPHFLRSVDILIGALPLTPETHGLLNADRLGLLPQGAFVINVGRGAQLIEADLRSLLDSGHLAGAALDVFQREPLAPDSWIWSHPKIFATPHIAGKVSPAAVARQVLAALQRVRAGQAPANLVDPARGY